MKISRYAIPFVRDNNYFLYNTLTLSLLSIDKATYDYIMDSIENPACINNIPKEALSILQDKSIIDDDRETAAKNFQYKMEYIKRLKSFGGRTLSLVIAPTLACHFACPYCYEANLPLTIMNEDTEDKIIEFINSFKDKCDILEICWEGGEPLLAFDRLKSLLGKIKRDSLLPVNFQSIVTNGYLLSEDIANYLLNEKLDFAQITIDGSPDTHNKSRILKSGGNTYERIINNIDILTRIIPECHIAVRTNVHEGNKNEFGSLYKELRKRWEGKNVSLYPAFVMQNSNCKVSCCTPQNKTDFFLNLKRNEKIDNINFVPKHKIGACSATAENCYIIAPDGSLYKCWNDIGMKERKIGSVYEGITNNTLIAEYMIGSDKYKDPKCCECSLFPICDGGCNRQRMDNDLYNKSYSLCPFTKEGIEEYLYEHYKTTNHE